MRQSTPIQLVVHAPTSLDSKIALARRVAEVHAQVTFQHIKKLNCPTAQKQALLDAIIQTAKNHSRELDR